MTTAELEVLGWRRVAEKLGQYRNTEAWTHNDHQPNRRGFFTKTSAINHAKYIAKVGHCSCIPKEQPR